MLLHCAAAGASSANSTPATTHSLHRDSVKRSTAPFVSVDVTNVALEERTVLYQALCIWAQSGDQECHTQQTAAQEEMLLLKRCTIPEG
jgi:hypothetical protein